MTKALNVRKNPVCGSIYSINGPVVTAENMSGIKILETVYVGHKKLTGEVISVHNDRAVIQVYEETSGLKPNEPVEATGEPMSVLLAPGLIGNIFDGIQRPLKELENLSGSFISRGLHPSAVDLKKKWKIKFFLKKGDTVQPLDIIGEAAETSLIMNKIMTPYDATGELIYIAPDGEYSPTDTLAVIKTADGKEIKVSLASKWPIRKPRPYKKREKTSLPLITGQRIIDVLFPVSKGGTAAIPGGFGTGKTMLQHQLAKWCDADIIIYIGCGERGNEMTQVLEEFSSLVDPKSGRPLSERTILIANTSNMPVAAREASIYTGITLGEYYRDMGYHVAIMADSTSRWAEALREISGRLEEMPAEEGFPSYLPSRLSEFYERAGYVTNLNGTSGSITIIGAVSPQGGDFSEPVTQNTRRFTRCFWGLDKSLAYSRHYPAINWLTSYSEYFRDLSEWYSENISESFGELRSELIKILQEENSLMDIVKLIGADVLPESQKLILEIAHIVRVGFLQQNAFHSTDTFVSPQKQFKMLEVIILLYRKCKTMLETEEISVSQLIQNDIFDKALKMKYDISEDELYKFDELKTEIDFKEHK